jgi:hypothetical protein
LLPTRRSLRAVEVGACTGRFRLIPSLRKPAPKAARSPNVSS